MADIWNYLKGLFSQSEESSPAQPYIHEMIERSEAEREDYARWKETLVCRRLIDWLSDQYAIFKVLPDDVDEAMDFLHTPSSKGFVIHFHKTRYSRRDVTFLLDYLKERVLALDYKTQISDTRTYNRDNWVETIERHYLKPKPDFMREGKFNQKYGNVTIDMSLRNDQPFRLKLQATIYKDHMFKEADAFQDLMQAILL